MPSRTYDITNLSDLDRAVEDVLATAIETSKNGAATVIALSGDLGAGKTTLVQTLARKLGVTDTVTSPTFVVMKQYELEHEMFQQLIHIDAYRIESIDEMRPLGFAELLRESNMLMCIEWAERIKELLPPPTITIDLILDPDETRTLTIHSI